MYILDQFWYGNLFPGETRHLPKKQYSEYLKTMEHCEAVMKSELSAAGQKALEEFANADLDLESLSCCDSFIEGFRLGALIMPDVLSKPCP